MAYRVVVKWLPLFYKGLDAMVAKERVEKREVFAQFQHFIFSSHCPSVA